MFTAFSFYNILELTQIWASKIKNTSNTTESQ